MRAKSSLVACLFLVGIAHALSLYWQLSGERFYMVRGIFGESLPLVLIGFVLPMSADLVLGAAAGSRRQLVLFMLAAVVALQAECLILDWTAGRFWMPWIEENYGRWAREIFWRFAFPVVFVSLGALLGALKRRYFLTMRSKHA